MGPKRRRTSDRSMHDSDHDDLPPLISQQQQQQQQQDACTQSHTITKTRSDDDDDEGGCLHCHTVTEDIQVRCYECNSYICDACHWCHEFQANHEIRVCDRCDGFYCRVCDEMDQCDDCGEVVCATCSTLLSCKFCGGGLCEECATACGRCGIVLCSRDAKFAVDCDTCRLSYCLVCLASGGKDPCVRCGHRPSKRMEQLVHLRLKSIYKAFKQSSGTNEGGSVAKAASSRTRERQNDDPDELHHLADDPEILLQAAAASASCVASSSSKGKSAKKASASSFRTEASSEEVYKKEKEKADAAAAALLAELEEEEEAAKSKKTKKKRKKDRHQAKQDEDIESVGHVKQVHSSDKSTGKDLFENTGVRTTDDKFASAGKVTGVDETGDYSFDPTGGTGGGGGAQLPTSDPNEQELNDLVENSDIEGIEMLMIRIKGVPGRAAVRKTAKKALKRLKSENCDEDEPVPVETDVVETSRQGAITPVTQIDKNGRTTELLSLVSLTHNKMSSAHGLGVASKSRSSSGGPKSECVMSMAPHIVGWVIGKGGQRIRDLMEESGARIWIDQDTMGPQEPRLCCISGQRKCVDTAMHLMKELVGKAPGTTPKPNTPVIESVSNLKTALGTKAPPMPDDIVQEDASDALILQPRHGSPLQETKHLKGSDVNQGDVKHVMTCDARFVPLLIGRRGWTIKHIQDTSLAWVDIDQSVTPRRITISGMLEHVNVAIEMVKDVLSYPQSQLQGTAPDVEEAYEEVSVKEENQVVEESLIPKVDLPVPAVSPEATSKARMHPSPPASLIMTTDAKGTVSASSSLSSTPEPSSSSSKGTHVQVSATNLLPPMQGPYAASTAEFRTASFSRIPAAQSRVVDRSSMHPPASIDVGGDEAFLLSHHSSSPFNQSTVLAVPEAPSALGVQKLAPVGGGIIPSLSLSQPVSLNKDPSFYHAHVNPSLPISTNDPIGHHHQNPYIPPQPTLAAQMIGPCSHPALLSAGNQLGAMGGPSLWDQPACRSSFPGPAVTDVGPSNSDEFRFDAAMEFLKHSKETQVNPVSDPVGRLLPTRTNPVENVGPRIIVPGHDDAVPLPALGREDSKMIDSLFGPPKASVNECSLLAGLQGLTLDPDKGLWSSHQNDTPRMGETIPVPLFPSSQDPRTAHDQRPLHSRFAWGESTGF